MSWEQVEGLEHHRITTSFHFMLSNPVRCTNVHILLQVASAGFAAMSAASIVPLEPGC